jgi:hypothetical protein
MVVFELFGLLPQMLLVSFLPMIAFGRNRGDLFLAGSVDIRVSDDAPRDLEALHHQFMVLGLSPIDSCPLIGTATRLPYGECVATLGAYGLGDHGILYVHRRYNDGD